MIGQRVFVYFDWQRKCWSLRSLATGRVLNYRPRPGGGREKIRVQDVALVDCEFKVSAAGRDRVRRTGIKNVHAGVVGTLVEGQDMGEGLGRTICYNPRLHDSFVDAGTMAPVRDAPLARLIVRGGRTSISIPAGVPS